MKGILKTIKGDATKPQSEIKDSIILITHVCNNRGGWGAGFVLAVDKLGSQPKEDYTRAIQQFEPSLILGNNTFSEIGNHKSANQNSIWVVNMIAQDGYKNNNNPRPLKYDHLVNCMQIVKDWCQDYLEGKSQDKRYLEIHCPKFGAGLAGGDWNFIEELIKDIWVEAGINVIVYEYDG